MTTITDERNLDFYTADPSTVEGQAIINQTIIPDDPRRQEVESE